MRKADLAKLLALTRAEWRLRQQSTFLGFLWTLLNPALMFAVLYGLFVKWLGQAQAEYASFLLIGIVQWNFFASATSYALSSLLRRSALLKNYPLPLEVPALAAVLSVYFSHLLELASMAAILLLMGARPTPAWLWLIPIDLGYLLLAAGAGLLLSGLFAFYTDLERIWGIILTAGFFLTPVFYPLAVLAPEKARLLGFSPLTGVIEASRSALLGLAPLTGALSLTWLWGAGAVAAGLLFLRLRRRAIGDAL